MNNSRELIIPFAFNLRVFRAISGEQEHRGLIVQQGGAKVSFYPYIQAFQVLSNSSRQGLSSMKYRINVKFNSSITALKFLESLHEPLGQRNATLSEKSQVEMDLYSFAFHTQSDQSLSNMSLEHSHFQY